MSEKMREALLAELMEWLLESGFALSVSEEAEVRAIIAQHLAPQPVSVYDEWKFRVFALEDGVSAMLNMDKYEDRKHMVDLMLSTRIDGGARPVSVPEGWIIRRASNGWIVIVAPDGLGDAVGPEERKISSATLYKLAYALLAAAPVMVETSERGES